MFCIFNNIYIYIYIHEMYNKYITNIYIYIYRKTCPVTLERNKYQNKKTIGRLPVIYNEYIIFLRNKSCQKVIL